MAERPLMFSAPMVRALLAGKKTVTRRPVTWRPKAFTPPLTEPTDHPGAPTWEPSGRHTVVHTHPCGDFCSAPVIRCPALAGDRIWVRETTYVAPPMFGDADLSTHTDDKGRRRMVGYVASMDHESLRAAEDYGIKQTPAVHMPRWAARILLDVVSVRVERLHAIDDADAEREGIRGWSKDRALWKYAPADDEGDGPCWPWVDCPRSPRAAFERLWTEINGAESWAKNPWVWRIEFRRVGAEVSDASR